MMHKKADGLPINVIIIAVLALIVLIVLAVIFSGKLGKFSTQTADTEKPFGLDTCDIPGTGRYCAALCAPGDEPLQGTLKCTDPSKGTLCCQKG